MFSGQKVYIDSGLSSYHVNVLQEETLGEARQVESEAATYLDQVSRYFISRGKLVSKVAKYPHIVSGFGLSCTI